jgi:hypothetical protein
MTHLVSLQAKSFYVLLSTLGSEWMRDSAFE